ncbi:hypothetical protein [Streptomyces synnematoformans]|uniref:Uncharacterized protein n=1 Tax=Streptomyces synnematoformans TaxID=415721 RepID=A0ABN1ZWU2_9ACTN
MSSATGRLDSATSWVERATAKTEEYDEKEGKDKPDDSEVRAAARNATDAKSAQAGAQRAVDNAEAGLEAAKKMAADAKKMREDAASSRAARSPCTGPRTAGPCGSSRTVTRGPVSA